MKIHFIAQATFWIRKTKGAIFFFFTCDQIGQTTAGPGTPVSLNRNNNRIRKPATSENYFLN